MKLTPKQNLKLGLLATGSYIAIEQRLMVEDLIKAEEGRKKLEGSMR